MIKETEWFRKLEGEYHYMGASHGAGDVVRLVFEEDGKAVALMTWAAACYRLKPRDQRIGWNPAMRAKRMKLVVNNRRYTELVPKGSRPNLASQVLGMAMRELPAIWERQWGYKPLIAETFCDIERTAGTCYRAAGWEEVGKTKGFSRVNHARDFYIPNGRPKVLFMKPFRKDAWDVIVSNTLPSEYDVAAHSKSDGILPFSPAQVESLHWELCHVKDPRGRNRSFGIGPLLAIFTMAVAAGAKDLKEAHGFVNRLSMSQLKELGCPKKKDAFNEEVDGEYVRPSYNAFYNLLRHKDKAGRYDFDVADYARHISKWMTAQAGKLPRHLAADGKFVNEVVGLVSIVDAESKELVAVAPASKKEGLKGRCEYPVLRDTLSGMDLSDAVVSTDALSCHDDTAHTVLANGGDYVLQVKANQKGILKQCETLSRIRPLVDSSKKKELNRGRLEIRETRVFRIVDPVEVGFPGAWTVIRTYRETWKTRKTGKKDRCGRDIRKKIGEPTKEVAWHVSSLEPDSRSAEGFARIVRTHWCVEVYHGKRDCGYHEDAFARRCDHNVMSAMMVARSFGMWICARHPEMTTSQAKEDLKLHPAKLVRIMMKGGLQ